MNRRLAAALILTLLAAATVAAYWPAARNGFIWDDDRYIETNQLLLHPAGLGRMWLQIDAVHQFYPLTFTTFWLEYHAWGLKPTGYHVDNIILHFLSCVILWRLLERLQFRWAAALLFAVHPVQVESVAWATERKNVLSGLFYFLSLAAYLRTSWGKWITHGDANPRPAGWPWYAASLLLFFAALASKSVTSTLPAVILLLAWWKRGRIRGRDVWPLVPMFVAGAAMGAMTSWVERNIVGAVGPEFDSITFFDRWCIAGRAIWFYLGKIIWPAKLTFIYPRWHLQPWFIAFAAAALVLLAGLWMLRGRIGRGPLAAMLFFAGTLMPALGFVNVFPMRYSFVADHFQYLACIGPIALLVAIVWRLAPRPAAAGVCVAAAAVLALASNAQCRIYRDRETLWLDTLAKNPDSAMVHANYAAVLMDKDDINAAEVQYREALRLNPAEPANRISIGFCYARRGDWQSALRLYADALDHSPDSPHRVLHRLRGFAYFEMGTAYGALARQSEGSPDAGKYLQLAEQAYRNAIQIVPDYEMAMDNLGAILADEGRTDEAVSQFQAAIAIEPDSIPAHEQLGNVMLGRRQFADATAQYMEILRIDPNNSHALNNLGTLAAAQGDWDRAIAMYRAALNADPQSAIARRSLMAAMAKKQAAGH
jgi:tetratricopeptide (TPR) repeat protein